MKKRDERFMKQYFKHSASPQSKKTVVAYDVSNRQAPLRGFQRVGLAKDYSFGKQLSRIKDFCGYVKPELVTAIEDSNDFAKAKPEVPQ